MMILKEKNSTVIKQIKSFLTRKLEYLRDRLEILLNIHPIYKGLVYTSEEKELIEGSSKILLDFFPENPGQTLLDEDFESRCEAIEDMGRQLLVLYEMFEYEIIITDEPDAFSPSQYFLTYGYASMAEKRVYINANCLQSDDAEMLERCVTNVLHELRHMIQYRVANLEHIYDVPYERRKAWRLNIINYIEAEYDLEGYYQQPIEFDARNFAGRVWQSAYHTNILEI